MNYTINLLSNIHIVTNSFTLLLRNDIQMIQHITVKHILDDNIGQKFLLLLDKHFPKAHKLSKYW